MAKILTFPGRGADTRADLPDEIKTQVEDAAMKVGALLTQVKNLEQQICMIAAAGQINIAAGNPNEQFDQQMRGMQKTMEKGWLQLADALGMGPDAGITN